MPSHDDIVRAFLDSGSVNFDAVGKFVSEVGPSITRSSQGAYGVVLGHYNFLACFNNRVTTVSEINRAAGEITREMTG